MVLPLILGMLGGALGPAVGLGALGGAALGSGLGSYAETGDLEKGILTGLGSFVGGALTSNLMGGTALGGNAPTAANAAKAADAGLPSLAAVPPPVRPETLGQPQSMLQKAMATAKTPQFMGQQIGGTLGGSLTGMFGSNAPKERKIDAKEMHPVPRIMSTPPTGYRPGFDPEWSYGISTPQSAEEIRNYNAARGFYGGGIVKTLGPIKLAEGGITALTGVDGKEFNSNEGVDAPPGGNEKDVVVAAIKALKGQLDDPRPALGRFLAMYGEDALRDLVDKVREGKTGEDATKGKVEGPGDGMNDRVPARIEDSGEDVLLSDNEYVVPADVVSGLGNGSSDAGARALDEMLNRVRKERTGKTEQPKPVAPEKVMPA